MTKKINRQLGSALLLTCTLLILATSIKASPSRDGKIAFASDRDGNREIYLMDADGSNQTRITRNLLIDDFPVWSPDGSKIAFVSQRESGEFAIFTMNPDGSGRSQIAHFDLYAPGFARSLSWSPDGTRLAFADRSDSKNVDIYVVGVDGKGRRNITSDHEHLDLYPVWSPDGSKIMFSRYDVYDNMYGGTMLHTINPDGTGLTRLLNGFADGWNEDYPDWSRATNKIVYSVNVWDFYFDAFIANADGTGRRLLHHCTEWGKWSDVVTPRFSGDGRKVVFRCGGGQQNMGNIYVINTDGSGLLKLTTSGRDSSPDWQSIYKSIPKGPSLRW
jgi:Tol biopolymer transport system component